MIVLIRKHSTTRGIRSSRVGDFRFKQFSVTHTRSAFKVGTDSILLGSWIEGAYTSVLDIGAGCGLLALMCAQKFGEAQVTGIEIDQAACEEASENFRNSPWSDRLQAIHGDVRDLKKPRFDLIISNPPYFASGVKPPDSRRTMARHEEDLSFAELIGCAEILSHERTQLAMILPAQRFEELIALARESGWELQAGLAILPKPNHRCERVAVKLAKGAIAAQGENLCITDFSGEYTPEFKALTREFYLEF